MTFEKPPIGTPIIFREMKNGLPQRLIMPCLEFPRLWGLGMPEVNLSPAAMQTNSLTDRMLLI